MQCIYQQCHALFGLLCDSLPTQLFPRQEDDNDELVQTVDADTEEGEEESDAASDVEVTVLRLF